MGWVRCHVTWAVFLQLFEGMKAFRGVDNHVRLFRPMMNMERMHRTAQRSCLPVSPTAPPTLWRVEAPPHASTNQQRFPLTS